MDGPTHFVPLALERQLPSGLDGEMRSRQADEERAADGWVQSIANAVAKLTFGLRAEALRVGVAVDGRLDGRGRDLVAMREGARARSRSDRQGHAGTRDRDRGSDGPLPSAR